MISATGKRYTVQVETIDRTAGFLKEMQTPKLQEPAFQWRNIEDRSAYAKLAFVGLSSAERESIGPGLPVSVTFTRKRAWLPQWFTTAYAASAEKPRLWPADSPLFTGARLTDARFEPVRRRVIEAADAALQSPPAPLETIHSAGVTDLSSPELQASRRAFQDADNFALLALAYRLTGKPEYESGARRVLAAWARIHRPTGMPIDETRLDPFLWGLDLLGPEARDPAVTAWLERWESACRAYRFGPVTSTNNHMTHHLKILVMLDRSGSRCGVRQDMLAVERQRKANLPSTDGKSIDYEQRDAMHYHVFDLEAWLEIALISGCCRESVDSAFQFLARTLAEEPDHVEFARSTAAIDRKRAGSGVRLRERPSIRYGEGRARHLRVFDAEGTAREVRTLESRHRGREARQPAVRGEVLPVERAPVRSTAESARQGFLFTVWIACLVLLLVYAPNRIWNDAAGAMVLSLGAIAAWRYSWWALHLLRAQIYSRIVFPRLRRRADALWQSGWRPRMLHFMVTTFREKPELTEAVLESIIRECRTTGIPAARVRRNGRPVGRGRNRKLLRAHHRR